MGLCRTGRQKLAALIAFSCVTICASQGHAFSSLFERVVQDASLSAELPESEVRATVEDGFLLGTGSERLKRLPDGNLRLERHRRYTRLRHPEQGKIVPLPQPWEVVSIVIVAPSLRLVSCDTRFRFRREDDGIFGDYKLSEHQEWLFEKDHTLVRASEDGKKLTHTAWLAGKPIKSERYDYPARAMPVEIISLLLGVAVQRHVDQFDFELLIPGGSTHGVRAQVHRTRDVRRFADGYRVPPQKLTAAENLAVIDMRLASPVKYVFFPHHFFLAYSEREPWKLMMMWGGDPDRNMQAFRVD